MLDGLRGVAAIAVMLYHAGTVFDAPGAFSRGYLFVDFFFLLSGFVLTLSAERGMAERGGVISFLRKRLVRLWPLAALGAVAGGGTALLSGDGGSVLLFLSLALLMIPALLGPTELYPLNGPQWSLFFELLANLAHALVLRHLSERGLLIAVAVWAIALAATILDAGSNTLGPFSFNWWWGLPRIGFSYTLGIWFARRWNATSHREILSWPLAFVLPVLSIVTLSGLPLTPALGDIAIVVGLFPLLFWAAATAHVPVEHTGWLTRLGAISFPLYALHLPMLQLASQFGKSLPMMLAGILAALGAAWLANGAMSHRHSRRIGSDIARGLT